MQTRAFLKLDKKCCIKLLRAKHLQVKGLIDNICHALEEVPERRAIHKLNAYFFLQKIKSECKYRDNTCTTIHFHGGDTPLRTVCCPISALCTAYRHVLASRTAYRLTTKEPFLAISFTKRRSYFSISQNQCLC